MNHVERLLTLRAARRYNRCCHFTKKQLVPVSWLLDEDFWTDWFGLPLARALDRF